MQIAYPHCPLCEHSFQTALSLPVTKHPLWHKPLPENLEWCVCDGCNHVFTRHYWDDAGLKEVFANSHEHQLAGADMHARRLQWAQSVDKAVRLLGGYEVLQEQLADPSWLDVGFGNGSLLMTANEYGFRTVGIDARTEAVERLQKLGYTAFAAQFDEVQGDPFTIISMCDVLEHLPYPRAALKKVQAMLARGGLLMISLPNMESSHWRMLDAEGTNPYWMELEHYHNFSRTSLSKLLAEEGFRVIDYGVSTRYLASMELFATPL